jgi:hypothetical protein
MKKLTSLCFVAAVAASFTVVNPATAAGPLLSPRAKADQIKVSPSSDISPNLVSGSLYGPAAKLEAARSKVVPGSSDDINLVSGNFAGPAAKNPYARPEQFELAPLAKPAKQCDADCSAPCCSKK